METYEQFLKRFLKGEIKHLEKESDVLMDYKPYIIASLVGQAAEKLKEALYELENKYIE